MKALETGATWWTALAATASVVLILAALTVGGVAAGAAGYWCW